MVEPVSWHPAADRATPEALVVEQDRGVVPLSTWLSDAAVAATATGRALQVLTPAYSRLTYPLELMLRDGGGQWVVRERVGGDGPERFRDGIAGFRLRWSGARFVTDLDAPPPDVSAAQPGSGDLEVQISTPHPADSALELGASTETVVRILTGGAPSGWGVAEPVTQPWSPREVTAHCRERAPSPTQLVVIGPGMVGQLHVERVDTGVLERLRFSGPVAGTVGQEVIETLAGEVAGTARSMIVAAHPGRLHGQRASLPTPPALPYGILIGHPVFAQHGVDHAKATPAAQVSILGQGARQACWCRLDAGPGRPYELLTAVLTHFGLPAAPG